jgi:hypothetical protein
MFSNFFVYRMVLGVVIFSGAPTGQTDTTGPIYWGNIYKKDGKTTVTRN